MCVKLQLQAPGFSLECVEGGTFQRNVVELSDYAGRWLVLVFYAHDFSRLAANELIDISDHYDEFCEGVSPMNPVELLVTSKACGVHAGVDQPLRKKVLCVA